MNIRKILPAIFLTSATMVPLKTAISHLPNNYAGMSNIVVQTPQMRAADYMKNIEIISDTNFVGGITKRFPKECVDSLRKIIKRDTYLCDYTHPIENKNNVYLEPFGMYFAKRPDGRPHMGLDIFVTPNARKPKHPVPVLAPIDGIVISNKRANPNDNIVANCVGLLGIDGKTYMFDHLARPTDYKDSVKMPEIGEFLRKGDSIGYVGRTGETDLWHLHLNVQTEEQLKKQLNSEYWLNISKQSPYSALRGQTDPLNENESGLISIKLNEYRKQHLETTKKMLIDYPGRENYLK